MKKLIKLISGAFKLFWGFCPKCNSDAPELYDCTVCNYYTHGKTGYVFPPTKNIKDLWWKKYQEEIKLKSNKMENKKPFEEWWEDFKSVCKRRELPINDQDAESYRDYYDDDYDPEEAAEEERQHFD